MRNAWPSQAVVMVVFVAALVGCSSTQPDRSESRTASLSFRAQADGILFDCWEVWQDNTGDSTPDVDSGYRACDLTNEPESRPVPWRYSLNISVIHVGATTEQIVTSIDGIAGSSVVSGDSVDDFVSMTDYDPTVGVPAPKSDDPANNIFFRNGKRVSVGSPVYLNAMNFGNIGTANVLTAPTSFDFSVTSGDTVIVRARKQSTADSPGYIVSEAPDLRLSATMSVGGTSVVTNGPTQSTGDDKAGFTFSYTVQ